MTETGEAAGHVLGVHIAAGKVYLGVVRCPDVALLEDPASRMEPAKHLDNATAFRDFADRVREELRRLQPLAVGVIHPRLYAGWKYRDAFMRVALETAVMVAAAEQGVEFESVKQERVSKAISVPLDPAKEFPSRVAERFQLTPPKLWNDRALAFGAAWALAQEYCR